MLLLLPDLHFYSLMLDDKILYRYVESHDVVHDKILFDKFIFRRLQQTQRVAKFFVGFPNFVRAQSRADDDKRHFKDYFNALAQKAVPDAQQRVPF